MVLPDSCFSKGLSCKPISKVPDSPVASAPLQDPQIYPAQHGSNAIHPIPRKLQPVLVAL
jgi:hypothetical protein